MTTEDLAKRFAELCGWERAGKFEPREVYKQPIDNAWHIFEPAALNGWASVGIVVDEMARRGRTVMLDSLRSRRDGVTIEWLVAFDSPRYGDTPLDAVLAAANAALEAEGAR